MKFNKLCRLIFEGTAIELGPGSQKHAYRLESLEGQIIDFVNSNGPITDNDIIAEFEAEYEPTDIKRIINKLINNYCLVTLEDIDTDDDEWIGTDTGKVDDMSGSMKRAYQDTRIDKSPVAGVDFG